MSELNQCCACASPAERKADKRGTDRLPRGWKTLSGELWCPNCVAHHWTLRALTLPVVWPSDETVRTQFRNALHASWKMSTRLSNWVILEFARRDAVTAGEKMPKFSVPYLYNEARAAFPELSSQSVVAILNSVAAKYRSTRFHALHTGKVSFPNYRYPQPYPVPAAAWSVAWLNETDRVPVLSLPLCGVRFSVRLKTGPHFRPQHADLADLIEGRAEPCEMALYERGDTLMAKLVLRLRKKIKAAKEGPVVAVRTDKSSLLIAAVRENEVWRYNCDQLPRWVAEHTRRLARLREDSKALRKTGQLSDPAAFREKIIRKQHQRMDSLTHMASAAVIGYATRLRASALVFDDTDRGFCESFPWYELKRKLAEKANAAGLEFTATQNEELAA